VANGSHQCDGAAEALRIPSIDVEDEHSIKVMRTSRSIPVNESLRQGDIK
jgi:hypothetical protein